MTSIQSLPFQPSSLSMLRHSIMPDLAFSRGDSLTLTTAASSSREKVISHAITGAKIGGATLGLGLPLAAMYIVNAFSGNPFGGDAPAAYAYLAVKGAVVGGVVGGAIGAVVGALRS